MTSLKQLVAESYDPLTWKQMIDDLFLLVPATGRLPHLMLGSKLPVTFENCIDLLVGRLLSFERDLKSLIDNNQSFTTTEPTKYMWDRELAMLANRISDLRHVHEIIMGTEKILIGKCLTLDPFTLQEQYILKGEFGASVANMWSSLVLQHINKLNDVYSLLASATFES